MHVAFECLSFCPGATGTLLVNCQGHANIRKVGCQGHGMVVGCWNAFILSEEEETMNILKFSILNFLKATTSKVFK